LKTAISRVAPRKRTIRLTPMPAATICGTVSGFSDTAMAAMDFIGCGGVARRGIQVKRVDKYEI
jgi:hypothetical protein